MGRPQFNDAQLQELLADPRFTEEDLKLLTPHELSRVQRLRGMGEKGEQGGSTLDTLNDVLAGFGKGAAKTAIGLGNAVHETPGLGHLTDALAKLVGPEGTDPEAAFGGRGARGAEKGLGTDPTNTAQAAGQTIEQVGEFFIPASPSRLGAIRQAVKLIPNSASPGMMRTLNQAATMAGRTAGEGGSAAAVSALHGDENPEVAGAVGAAVPTAAKGMSGLVGLLKSPLGRRLFPYLAASTTLGTVGALNPVAGLASSMGMFGLAKEGATKLLRRPGFIQKAQRGAEQTVTQAGRGATGSLDQVRARRRRLEREQ